MHGIERFTHLRFGAINRKEYEMNLKRLLRQNAPYILLIGFIIAMAEVMEYADKHEPIDPALVARNRAVLVQCDDACINGFIRRRNGTVVSIVPDSEVVFPDYNIGISKVLALSKQHDSETDRFFNKIDSVILPTDKLRWQDSLYAYAMQLPGSQ